jgi:hypothetical protein
MSTEQEPKLLVSFVLSQDLTLRTTELNARGVDATSRPNRTPARLAMMLKGQPPFTEGPLTGFKIEGSNKEGGYRLLDSRGALAASVRANGIFEVCWDVDYIKALGTLGFDFYAWSAPAVKWLQDLVIDLKDSLDKEAIRRTFLAWLEKLGFEPTGLPGLYEGPLSKLEELDKVLDALPEAEWGVWSATEL